MSISYECSVHIKADFTTILTKFLSLGVLNNSAKQGIKSLLFELENYTIVYK